MGFLKTFLVLFFLGAATCACSQTGFVQKKLAPGLQQILQNSSLHDSITLLLSTNKNLVYKDRKNIRVLYRYPAANAILVRLQGRDVLPLLAESTIVYARPARQPKEELTTGAFDLSLNKISAAHAFFPQVTGSGILVSVKEQALDTADVDIKGRYRNTGVNAQHQTTHAAIMATIIAGGGNTSLLARGAARGALVTSSDFALLLPDADSVYRNHRITVQNHSYGTAIENEYAADAAAYDISVWNNPTLVHVFSAGNSGTGTPATGTYMGLSNSANVTGSFKMSKNSIAVGHVDSFNRVAAPSSRGPAYDGRIKPELVAFGEDGSSGAAALVSGAVALVQQAYAVQHNGALPTASLVKAILLNSADDIEKPHPDYTSGYGSLNALNALRTVTKNAYFEATTGHGDLKKFVITVPPQTAALKLTLAWTDTAAAVNAATALVNDLDLTLTTPAGETLQPWVLNAAPDAGALALPATRQRDTLNNVEQITLDNPVAGTYTASVAATRLLITQQPFAIAYQTVAAKTFEWTYPTSETKLLSGKPALLRWQTARTGTAQLSYTSDGLQWNAVGTADLSTPYFKWQLPNVSQPVIMRMQFSDGETVLSHTFVVSQPITLTVGYRCGDSVLLQWNAQATASYQVYGLGAFYMEPILTTTDTFAVLHAVTQRHYSVAPVVFGQSGFSSATLDYTLQGIGCYVRTFTVRLQSENEALALLQLGTTANIERVVLQKWNGQQFADITTASKPLATTLLFSTTALTQGENRFRVILYLRNGQTVASNTEVVYYFPANPVLFYPNPARYNERITAVVQEADVYSIQVSDATGRLVYKQRLEDGTQRVPAFRLATGVYFVRVQTDNGNVFTQKLIVY